MGNGGRDPKLFGEGRGWPFTRGCSIWFGKESGPGRGSSKNFTSWFHEFFLNIYILISRKKSQRKYF